MPRADQVVSRVRQFMAESSDKVAPGAEELVGEYTAIVNEVNSRLDRCVSLLRQGMRSEALHLAEMSPPALEEAAALDFPMREQWATFCDQHDLGGLPEVNVDAAVEIDEAFVLEQQLARLLRAHRRLALGRAPLRSRIKILRRLSQADANNPVWGEDLVEFEQARHKQIASEARTAWAARDLAALEALDAECHEIWLEDPPASLRQSVRKLRFEAQDEAARAEMSRLDNAIATAHGGEDVAATTRLLKRWQAAAQRTDGPSDALKTAVVLAAEAWVKQIRQDEVAERAFQKAVVSFEMALDERVPLEELARQWAQLVEHQRPIPHVLETRYEARVSESRLESSRRYRLVLLLFVGGLLIVAGSVGYLIHLDVAARQVEHWHGQITLAIEADHFDEAQKLLDHLARRDEVTWQSAEIQGLVHKLRELVAAESIRKQRLGDALERAVSAGEDHPSIAAMELASQLARTDQEKATVDRLRARIKRAALRLQKQRDEAFTKALDAIRKGFAELRAGINSPDQHLRSQLQQMRRSLSEHLAPRKLSPALQTAGRTVLVSIDSVLTSVDEQLERRRAMQSDLVVIRAAYKQPRVLADELAKFADAYPESPFARDFRKAALTASVCEAVRAWPLAVPSGKSVRVRDPNRAKELIADLDAYVERSQSTPYERALSGYSDYLKRAENTRMGRYALDDPEGDVLRVLMHPLVRGLNVLIAKDNTRYYTMGGKTLEADGTGYVYVKYLVSVEQVSDTKRIPAERLHRSRFLMRRSRFLSLEPKPSPQSRFASAARKWISEGRYSWETAHLHLCQMLMDEREMDPIFQATLASSFVRLSRSRDWIESPEMAAWGAMLDGLNLDVNWIEPDTASADTAREVASDVLDTHPDFNTLRKQLDKWDQDMGASLAQRRPVGLIWRSEDESIAVTEALGGLSNGRLEVVSRDKTNRWSFVPVGELADGTITWNDAAIQQPAGTIVYCPER